MCSYFAKSAFNKICIGNLAAFWLEWLLFRLGTWKLRILIVHNAFLSYRVLHSGPNKVFSILSNLEFHCLKASLWLWKNTIEHLNSVQKILCTKKRHLWRFFLPSLVLKMTIFLDVSRWIRPIPHKTLAKIRPNKGGLVLRTLESKIENHAWSFMSGKKWVLKLCSEIISYPYI